MILDHSASQQMAEDVLTMALAGSMPSSYYLTDQRILRACGILDIDPEFAEQYAEEVGS